jgi:hypothetical protein
MMMVTMTELTMEVLSRVNGCGQYYTVMLVKVMLNIVLTVQYSGCQIKNDIMNGVVVHLNYNNYAVMFSL